jgi:hypothetical protein
MRAPGSPRYINQYTGYRKPLASIPFPINELQASRNFTRLPAPARSLNKKIASAARVKPTGFS